MRAFAILIVPLILITGCVGVTDFYGKTLEPKPLIEFELVDQNNEQFNLTNMDAEVIMVGFIHTSCGEECDGLTASMKQVYELLSTQDQERVSLLSITTDPWHDDSSRLYHYMLNNSLEWPHLTVNNINSELGMMESVWESFGTAVNVTANESQSMARCSIHLMDYTVNHTIHVILIDEDRTTRVQWLYSGWDSEEVAADIRRLSSE
jgi:cytochrome oxidase Cu insertion factor (SCO1/SenC/PrrC family)